MIEILKHKYSKYVISIILGFGLGTLFKKTCDKDDCFIFKVPDLNNIHNQNFRYHDKCYKYTLVPGKCDPMKQLYS
jgi:hypothetical protein